jgi:hypothetical protein
MTNATIESKRTRITALCSEAQQRIARQTSQAITLPLVTTPTIFFTVIARVLLNSLMLQPQCVLACIML